jgi:hypothetical protein
MNQRDMTGWRSDPTDRHEGRFYVAGRPTNRVRDGRRETTDPVGGSWLPHYVEVPAPGIRATWLATGVTTVIVVLVAGVVWVLLGARKPSPPPEDGYLAALSDAGLASQFDSDPAAVAHGRQVCHDLDSGGPQQGLLADKLAVDAFCPQYSRGFRLLDMLTATGMFVLIDSTHIGVIDADPAGCHGSHGYSDIGHDTTVTVTNGTGAVLATTVLGDGKGDTSSCSFSFSFPATEGQDRYIVSIGHRGEFGYSFDQLRNRPIEIHLGH